MESLQEDYPERLYNQLKKEVKKKERANIQKKALAVKHEKLLRMKKLKDELHVKQIKSDAIEMSKERRLLRLRAARKSKRKAIVMSMSNPYKTTDNKNTKGDDDS